MEQYFALKTKPHEDNFEETCEKIKFYLDDSIEKQLVSDVPLGMMLSLEVWILVLSQHML